MRWTMPIFALALAIALGAIGPQPVRQPAGPGRAPGHAVTAPLALPSLAGFSLFASAEATTPGRRPPGLPVATHGRRGAEDVGQCAALGRQPARLVGWSDRLGLAPLRRLDQAGPERHAQLRHHPGQPGLTPDLPRQAPKP